MKHITIPAKIECLEEVIGFIEEELAATESSAKIRAMINIAVEEIFVNIAHYAYEKEGDATIGCAISGNTMTVTFTDSGHPYNPLEKEDPDTAIDSRERSIGGLGIFITKKSMDNIQYQYKNGKNVLTIEKKLI